MGKLKALQISMAVVLVFGLLLTACTQKEESTSTTPAPKEVITINYPTFNVGAHVSAKSETAMLDRFNQLYGEEIKIEIEEYPGDIAYIDKMKVLAATKELPLVVGGKNGVKDLAVKNGQAVDLRKFFEQDPEFRALFSDEVIAANTEADGSIYSLAVEAFVIGYYYNKEMFEKAGITPAKTWDEFMSNNDKLLAKGFIPLSLGSGENSWTANLILAAMIATDSADGLKWMNTKYPTTYNVPAVTNSLKKMQTLFQKYTTPDALGGTYNNAANNFLQGKTAIIANGPWMIADFSNTEKALAGFQDKVGVAAFPGNGMVFAFQEGQMIAKQDDTTEEELQAAWKLFKALSDSEAQTIRMTMAGFFPSAKLEIPADYKASNPIFANYVDSSSAVTTKFMYFDIQSYPSVIDAFGKYYPELTNKKITAEQMATKLDEAAAKNK
jgi:raffinose/stachyose/melibiose transport system substrate-binding protein